MKEQLNPLAASRHPVLFSWERLCAFMASTELAKFVFQTKTNTHKAKEHKEFFKKIRIPGVTVTDECYAKPCFFFSLDAHCHFFPRALTFTAERRKETVQPCIRPIHIQSESHALKPRYSFNPSTSINRDKNVKFSIVMRGSRVLLSYLS